MTLLTLADFLSIGQPGGLGRVAWESSRALATAGHEVLALEPRRGTPTDPEGRDGVTVYRSGDEPSLSIAEFASPRVDLLRLALDRSDPDGVVIHGPLSGWVAQRCTELRSRLTLLVFHSPWSDEYEIGARGVGRWLGSWVRRSLEHRTVAATRSFLTLSGYMADRLATLHGVSRQAIRVAPGGVDLEHFAPGDGRAAARRRLGWDPESLTLFAVRNLRPRMGLPNLLEALARLRAALPEVRLVLAGRGPLRAELEGQARALGLAEAVDLVGFVDDADLPEYLRAADLAVVPTAALEGFGLVLLEALACGTPVVSTPVGGIPEVLGGLDPGLISATPSAQDLATTLRHWLEDREARERLAERCRSYVEANFTWSRFADAIVDSLERQTDARPA